MNDAFFDHNAGPPPLHDDTCSVCGTPFDDAGDCSCTLAPELKMTPEQEAALVARCRLVAYAKIVEMQLLGEWDKEDREN